MAGAWAYLGTCRKSGRDLHDIRQLVHLGRMIWIKADIPADCHLVATASREGEECD